MPHISITQGIVDPIITSYLIIPNLNIKCIGLRLNNLLGVVYFDFNKGFKLTFLETFHTVDLIDHFETVSQTS